MYFKSEILPPLTREARWIKLKTIVQPGGDTGGYVGEDREEGEVVPYSPPFMAGCVGACHAVN